MGFWHVVSAPLAKLSLALSESDCRHGRLSQTVPDLWGRSNIRAAAAPFPDSSWETDIGLLPLPPWDLLTSKALPGRARRLPSHSIPSGRAPRAAEHAAAAALPTGSTVPDPRRRQQATGLLLLLFRGPGGEEPLRSSSPVPAQAGIQVKALGQTVVQPSRGGEGRGGELTPAQGP